MMVCARSRALRRFQRVCDLSKIAYNSFTALELPKVYHVSVLTLTLRTSTLRESEQYAKTLLVICYRMLGNGVNGIRAKRNDRDWPSVERCGRATRWRERVPRRHQHRCSDERRWQLHVHRSVKSCQWWHRDVDGACDRLHRALGPDRVDSRRNDHGELLAAGESVSPRRSRSDRSRDDDDARATRCNDQSRR